jgi:sterol desaturase/sphingolipid hydroxylase (fatty acid hydroxylase superfamily)
VMLGAFGVEAVVSMFIRRDGHYQLKDTAANVATMIGYVGARLAIGMLVGAILLGVYELTPLRWSMAWWHWLVLFVVEDFSYYWSHRASHRIKFMWFSHASHHNSPILNLSTGLRNSWFGGLIDWPFWVPMVALGFHPICLMAVVGVVSAWDFMTHTPYVGKLPGFDFVFNSPSNHRVHHGKNPQYVDKNYGSVLIIWDRMFGTYEPEVEKVEYGVVDAPARPNDPIYIQVYLWRDWFRGLFSRGRGAGAFGGSAARTLQDKAPS